MQEDTVGPDSVLPFKILWSSPGFIFLFEFVREGHLISVWVHILWSGQSLKPPLRTVLVRSCEVGGRSSTLLVIFSGESADGCCPRLDIYSNIDYFLFQAILPNKFCIVIKYQVWVVFFLICCCLDLCVCTLQWHSALLQKVLECQYFAKWPGGSHQQTFYRIHPLRREGC